MNGEEILLKAIDDTINSYANCLTYYARWMDENHTDCNRLPIAHKRHYDHEFIQYLIDTHAYSPATIKLYTAALTFVHSCTMNEVHNNRPTVRAEDTTRSRSYTEEKYENQLQHRFKYSPMAVAHIMQICRITELRRDEAEQIRPSNFWFAGKVYHCHLSGNPNRMKYPDEKTVWTKGGRERTMENGKSRPTRYHDSQGYTWDRDALLRVSASLGHKRSEVVVRHYLWRLRQANEREENQAV